MPHRPTPSDWSPSPSMWARLSPNQQLGYGCLFIAVISALVMYCAGTVSILVRPGLIPRAATPTSIIPTLSGATATKPPPTIIPLPPGTLLATPTQAPIPTREPPTPTLTPTSDAPSTLPAGTPLAPTVTRVTPTLTRTPTRLLTSTATPRR